MKVGGLVRSSEPRPSVVDPWFYRRRYGDLMVLESPEALARHYDEHGHREGRFGNAGSYIAALERIHGLLPPDFAPSTYRSCHRDLVGMTEDWQVTAHYLEFGRAESRPYRVDLSAYEELHRWSLRGDGESFADLLASHGLSDGAWLERFDLGSFVLLNADWLAGRATSRIAAIQVFVSEGVERLAPIAMDQAFDPEFYRATYSVPDAEASPAALYRDWLCRGMGRGFHGSETQFLASFYGENNFPCAFDEARYRSNPSRSWPEPGPGRVAALEHFFDFGFAAGIRDVVVGADAARLYEQLSGYLISRDCPILAAEALDLAVAGASDKASLYHQRAEVKRRLGHVSGSVSDFTKAADEPDSDVWSQIHAAEGLAELGHTGPALDRIVSSARRWHSSAPWRAAAHRVLAAYFAHHGDDARALYRAGNRAAADALMLSTMRRVAETLPIVDPLPIPLPLPIDGPIVLLANRDLPQCDHYRVEQKRRQLNHGGWRVEIYSPAEIASFRSALDRARAALFYRVPAHPAVLHAILYARALGLPTIYEIDDLIFDSAVYPDPFESFEGQISREDYANLQHGVPQFRFAMSQCDMGLASTPLLADAMRPIVRSGRVHVLRNGLDERNLPYLKRDWTPFSTKAVTIFYGSGTKAHNQDFSELAAPALLAVLRRHPHVRLLIAGHLRLDDRFLPLASRLRRLDFTADVDAYWEVLSGVDINLAVLLRSPMSDAKSEIKWLEAAMCGVPSIVSGTGAYREILTDGDDALIADTPSEWEDALERLVSDPELRRRIGRRARDKAQADYSLAQGSRTLKAVLPPPAVRKDPSVTSPQPARPEGRPRVLIVNVYFPPQTVGGATRVVRDNVDHFLAQGAERLELGVATIDDGAEPPYRTRIDGYRGVPVFRIAPLLRRNMDWHPADATMGVRFAEILDRFAPDLVHFHCIQRLTATVVEVVRERGLPYVVTVHDGWWISDHQFLIDEDGMLRMPTPDPLDDVLDRDVGVVSIARRRRLGRALEGAEAVLAVSESFARIYRAAGHPKVVAVPNGVSKLRPIARVPSQGGSVRIGHVGGRSAHKGVTLIEQVLRANAFDNLALILVDHAQAAGHFKEEIWGATPVRIIGRVPQEGITELYAQLDVLLAPSIWPESFGLVTREAHQAGLWVVASDRGAIGEGIRDGVDGFRVDVSTSAPLRAVLGRINADPARFLRSPPPLDQPVRTAADQGAELLELYQTLLTRTRRDVG